MMRCALGKNRGREVNFFTSARYALGLKPRSNDQNNRNKNSFLHWCNFLCFMCHELINSLDEGLTPTKDGGTCLRRLSMFRKEVH